MILISLILIMSSSTFITNIKNKFEINNNENIAIFYMDMVDCVKCYIEPVEVAEYLDSKNVTIIGAINCDRELELKVFKKNNNWKYHLIVDENRKTRKLLNGNDNIYLSIIKKDGKILHLTKSTQKNTTQKNIKKINDFLF